MVTSSPQLQPQLHILHQGRSVFWHLESGGGHSVLDFFLGLSAGVFTAHELPEAQLHMLPTCHWHCLLLTCVSVYLLPDLYLAFGSLFLVPWFILFCPHISRFSSKPCLCPFADRLSPRLLFDYVFVF